MPAGCMLTGHTRVFSQQHAPVRSELNQSKARIMYNGDGYRSGIQKCQQRAFLITIMN